ncbi:MAG: hypothetical protein R2816_02090 [Flavobacteriaceae bacterium]|nr:hypothetical protein [Flavobacteriaceae bacterium]
MAVPQNFDELITQASSENLYVKLVRQLNKDFLLANIDLDFEEDILPTSLKYMLQDIVFKLIQERFSEYLNVLYIVDVPEQKVKQLDGSDIAELSEQVTFLILQREWQKVWYKDTYRS